MMKNNNHRATYFWFGLFAINFILFQTFSYYIRPNYSGNWYIYDYFLGVAPNFFPAIGIPALIYALIELNKSKNAKFIHQNALHISLLSGIVGLIIWEFMQFFSTNLSFDWHDIIWTMAGGLIFFIIAVKRKP